MSGWGVSATQKRSVYKYSRSHLTLVAVDFPGSPTNLSIALMAFLVCSTLELVSLPTIGLSSTTMKLNRVFI